MSTIISTLKPLTKSTRDYLLSLPSSALAEYLRSLEARHAGTAAFVLDQLRQDDSALERKRKADRERQAQIVARGQEIGRLPTVVNPERRARARMSLQYHLETYHRQTFNCDWAPYHEILMDRGQTAVWEGGWFAFAVPRGGGKSSIAEGLVEWAILHGWKRWPILIGATDDKALTRLKNIKIELRRNRLLREDFPEICVPIAHLGRSARRAEGQLCCGAPTAMEWRDSDIVLPTILEDEWERWAIESFDRQGFERPLRVGGSKISAIGLLGDIRGFASKTEDLDSIRPDLAVPDDPQTRESAKSYTQSTHRAEIITGDVAYLNGPETEMSVLVPCTVIYQGDLADQLLDRNTNPQWHGERHKMLISLPTNLALWDEYAELKRECDRLDLPATQCNAFYLEHKADMDAGAEASWVHRYPKNTHSAIQHAMNLRIKNEAAFNAEAQNEPITHNELDNVALTVNQVLTKIGHWERGHAPAFVEKIAAHIDVQQRLLYWMVAGASKQFEAGFLDAGEFPNQGRNYFSYGEQLYTIQDVYPTERLEVQLYLAIQELISDLATRRFLREDGVEMQVGLILVDCGWNDTVVVKACRESPFASLVIPAQGLPVRAKDTPLSMRPKKPGQTKGHEWILTPKPDTPSVLYLQADANNWKTELHLALRAEAGPGSMRLWHDKTERHRMTAEHFCAEKADRVTVGNRSKDEWQIKPGRPDNHRFDNGYNCMVGLSYQGCVLPRAQDSVQQTKKRTPRTF